MTTASASAPRSALLVVHRRRNPGPIELEALAREAGLHPDLVRRFVQLGLLEPMPGRGAPRASRATRPRVSRAPPACAATSSLGYAAPCFATELLARIDELEARLRIYESPNDNAR